MPRLTLDALRRDLETFGFEVAEEDYQNAVGLKDDVDAASVFERFEHLSTEETLAFVKKACSHAAGDDLRRLRFLEADVLGSVVSNVFIEEEDALATEASRTKVAVDGEVITYRSIGVRIEEEDDRARRKRLALAEEDVDKRFLPREESLERRCRAVVAKMGYPDDATWWETVHRIPLDPIDRHARGILDDTAGRYVRALADRLERVENISLKDAEQHDVSHMMRAKAFDAHFSKERLVPLFHGFLKGLGFDVARLPNVTVDVEDRPNKDPRAFVLPAKVPHDVRLVTRPTGGVDDYRSLFHEAGHMLHFALTRADLPYEDRYFGDDGVTESYAFLFEHLFENPLFLKEAAPTLEGEALTDFLHYSALDKLSSLRYYSKALGYDLWYARHDHADGGKPHLRSLDEILSGEAPARYVKDMQEALRIPASPVDYLSTDGFYGVSYLRAWLFEALHRRWLEREFGAAWWRNPKVGDHLRRFYVQGTRPTVEDLARELGHDRVTVKPLVEDVARLLEARGVADV